MRRYNRLRRWASGSEPVTSWIIALALFALVVLVYLILFLETLPGEFKYLTRWPEVVVAAWDLAVLPLLVLPWRTILSSDAKATERRAAEEDPGRKALLVIPVLASMAALVAATGVIAQSVKTPGLHFWVSILLGVFAVAGAWAWVHTTFALHYARLYYPNEGEAGGLDFPGLRTADENPDDLYFAYFSFMIGTAFQGSDVGVSSRSMRRVVLAHAVLAFVFNTVILALAINVVFDVL
jgi:uncharacterized membrane protein